MYSPLDAVHCSVVLSPYPASGLIGGVESDQMTQDTLNLSHFNLSLSQSTGNFTRKKARTHRSRHKPGRRCWCTGVVHYCTQLAMKSLCLDHSGAHESFLHAWGKSQTVAKCGPCKWSLM